MTIYIGVLNLDVNEDEAENRRRNKVDIRGGVVRLDLPAKTS